MTSTVKNPYTPNNSFKEEIVPFNGANFHVTFWPVPEGQEVKGRVLFVHGFSEYSKLYVRISDDFVKHGYEVYFFDQRGSGLTSPKSSKGITDEFHTFNDLDFFIERNLQEIEHFKKLYLVAHSMGGGISLNYGVKGKYKDQISGIISTGPLILLHPNSKPSKLLFSTSAFLMKFIPKFKIDTALKPEYVTSDPEWDKFASTDPNIVPLIGSLRQIYDFIKRGEKLLEESYVKNFSVPVLILHGQDDRINDPDASAKFIDLIPYEDKKLVLIPGGCHSLFIEKKDIYELVEVELFNWLAKH